MAKHIRFLVDTGKGPLINGRFCPQFGGQRTETEPDIEGDSLQKAGQRTLDKNRTRVAHSQSVGHLALSFYPHRLASSPF